MKNTTIITIITVFTLFSLLSNAQNFEWAKQMGGTDIDIGNSITTDVSGNVYTIGEFYNTADFDPGVGVYNLTSAGSYDIFVSKLDASGNFVWAKSIGGVGVDVGWSVATDASGNLYVIGSFGDTVDFDPGAGVYNLTSAGSYDIFVSKLDASGNFVWAKSMGGTGWDEGRSIFTDSSSNVYTTGFYEGTADFDPGVGVYNLTSAGSSDIFISKLDASGNFVWVKSIGGTDGDGGYSITTDVSGNIYTTGFYEGTADFDPGVGVYNLTSAGSSDIFISKLDASGNFVWAKRMGGISSELGRSITSDISGNIYTTGSFEGTADFDPGVGVYNLTSAGSSDIFISKLDASGNFMWVKSIGGTDGDDGYSIATDASGNVYTTGTFWGTADFNPGVGLFNLTSAGISDIFISKLDASGNFMWAKSMGGSGWDQVNSITIDASGNLYTTGYFIGTVDFDIGIGVLNLSAVGIDIFVHKMSVEGVGYIKYTEQNKVSIFPNPNNGIFNIETNKAHICELYNSLGKIVYTSNLQVGNNNIQLPNLAAGVYLIKLYNGTETYVERLVVNP
jgi:hypothetical protein